MMTDVAPIPNPVVRNWDHLTFTWEVTSVKIKDAGDFTNAVIQTYWKKTGTDANGNTGSFSGATPFDADTIDPENFTAFEDLTEEMVLSWIQNAVLHYEDHVNEQIQKQIDDHKAPKTEVSGNTLPWSN